MVSSVSSLCSGLRVPLVSEVPLVKYLSIDIGVVNVGINVTIIKNKDLYVYGTKISWPNWKKDINIQLLKLIEKFELRSTDSKVFIEKQIKQSPVNIQIMSYIDGYFNALQINVKILKPVSNGLKLKTRIERKKVSIDFIKNIIPMFQISQTPKKLTYKYHDVTDSIMLCLNEINYTKFNMYKLFIDEI